MAEGIHQFIYAVGEAVVGFGALGLLFFIGYEIEQWIRNR